MNFSALIIAFSGVLKVLGKASRKYSKLPCKAASSSTLVYFRSARLVAFALSRVSRSPSLSARKKSTASLRFFGSFNQDSRVAITAVGKSPYSVSIGRNSRGKPALFALRPNGYPIMDASTLRPSPSVDGEHRQRTGDRDQIASREPARDNRAASRVTDRKFTG